MTRWRLNLNVNETYKSCCVRHVTNVATWVFVKDGVKCDRGSASGLTGHESGAFPWGCQPPNKWKFMVCQLITIFVLSLLLVGTCPSFICSVPICRTCSNGANTYVWNAPSICSCVSIYCSTYPTGSAHSISPAFWTGAEAGEYSIVWCVLRQPCVIESFIQLLILYTN
jgi:hypothetical protein